MSHASLQADRQRWDLVAEIQMDALCCLRHLGASRVFSLDPELPEEQLREAGSPQSHHVRVVNGSAVWETCYLELLCWVQTDFEMGK